MKKTVLLFFSSLVCFAIFAQKKQPPIDLHKTETAILEEGRKLYQLQMATTLGLEAFLQLPKDVVDSAAGYFAFREGKFYKCVFYNNLYNADIISTILFDSAFNKVRTAISNTLRPMTNNERDLYFMRIRTMDEIKKDTSLFKLYTTTTTIVLPIIDNNDRRVFVLTKSDDPATVLFGNDYVLDFDKANYVSAKKAIHNDLISIDCVRPGAMENEELSDVTHKHQGESGEFMTATDVCTILMNQKKAGWGHQVVKSENYVSVWYCDSDELETMPIKKWNKHKKEDKKDSKGGDADSEAKAKAKKKESPVAFTPQGTGEQKLWTYDQGLITVSNTH